MSWCCKKQAEDVLSIFYLQILGFGDDPLCHTFTHSGPGSTEMFGLAVRTETNKTDTPSECWKGNARAQLVGSCRLTSWLKTPTRSAWRYGTGKITRSAWRRPQLWTWAAEQRVRSPWNSSSSGTPGNSAAVFAPYAGQLWLAAANSCFTFTDEA